MTLIERIEAASATDHLELDAIDLAIAEWCYTGGAPGLVNYDPEMWLIRNGGWASSTDAAVGLAERVFPGCRVMVERANDGTGWAMLESRTMSGKVMADASTPALALLAAILRAREGEG
jgi:hypothetical protein